MPIPFPAPGEYAPFYAGYLHEAPAGDLLVALAEQGEHVQRLVRGLTDEQAHHRYAPGKWSVKEVAGHLADTERLFAARALRVARADATPLPGFDENEYVAAAGFERLSQDQLADELAAVRAATRSLLGTLPEDAWARTTEVNGGPMSARAIAYIIVGHERHHLRILHERYGLGG
jgi:uncharacterized damage-inducible protein DinB